MDEKKQIERAALLSDTKPAETLDTVRAHSFVASTLKPEENEDRSFFSVFFDRYRAVAFGATAALACAAVAIAVIVVRPSSDEFGSPAVLSEQSYIHAATAEADSSIAAQQDSLMVVVEE